MFNSTTELTENSSKPLSKVFHILQKKKPTSLFTVSIFRQFLETS